jgi:hypothetical protein
LVVAFQQLLLRSRQLHFATAQPFVTRDSTLGNRYHPTEN